ncbi:MAG: crotonase/enoyl-CoA hydratase family protein [Pseudomonadota bacterium]
MTPTTLTYAVADGIATITLDRPDAMNAFNRAMMDDLIAAFDATDADDAVRAVVVTGAGERAFCAGADLSAGAATFDYAERGGWDDGSPFRADGRIDYSHPGARDGGGKVALRIFASRKPVIGAINGAAVGIGATMTLPMDFRLASETARFGFVFARRGIVPEAASSWFLPRIVGIGQALEWCYAGDVFDAAEALRGGLVKSVHAPADLLPAAYTLAERLTGGSAPVSVAMTRKLLWAGLASAHPMDAHRRDSRAIWARGAAGDAKEGVASFLEKRAPSYPDRVTEKWDEFAAWFDDPPYD